MPVKKLKEFLDQKKVKYMVCIHSTAYTAQEIAATAHIPGKELVKTVMVKLDGRLAMAVLTASQRVNFDLLKKLSKSKKVELASEEEFKSRFPDCEVGAMPPFGNLYELEIYTDEKVSEDKEITFNAGSHRELIKLSFADFKTLAKPVIGKLASV
jgi:Ala-tRNA(Pro) deacylase